jgi:Met-zincin
LLHRYQVEAASKSIGGMDYTFALRGDGQTPLQILAPAEQRRALTAVLATLKPDVLALPESLLKIIPPRVPDYERGREHFKIRTSPAFDALAPAEAAAEHTLQFLFNGERASRLVEFHARDARNPGLEEVLDAVLNATWKSLRDPGYFGEVSRVVDTVVLYDLMSLAVNERASQQARAIASLKLEELKKWSTGAQTAAKDSEERAHLYFAATQIAQFQKDPKLIPIPTPAQPPDGPPIGDDDCTWLR